jgi:hypothetical protein
MRNVFLLTVTMRVVLLLTTLATRSFAEEVKPHRLTQVPLAQVVIEDEFEAGTHWYRATSLNFFNNNRS